LQPQIHTIYSMAVNCGNSVAFWVHFMEFGGGGQERRDAEGAAILWLFWLFGLILRKLTSGLLWARMGKLKELSI